MITLTNHQRDALKKLRSGCILVGGTGSGKTLTSLAWYFENVGGGTMMGADGTGYSKMQFPKDLYVITTARKRDTLDWQAESGIFILEDSGVTMTVDSWNQISKYTHIKNAVFIFDEQRVVGSGVWVDSFLKITKNNEWILLSATPGDSWIDYVPVFIANNFYKNRTEFIARHVVYSPFIKFPVINYYIDIKHLVYLREKILVNMTFVRHTTAHHKSVFCSFDVEQEKRIRIDRWNIYEDCPIKNVSEMCRVLRKLVNSDPSRIKEVKRLLSDHDKLVIFYNFDFEWYMLLDLCTELDIPFASWNGHQHQPIPETKTWIYMNQYMAGAEAWNCTETNAMIFYSANYSYKQTIQSEGRIDRYDTPFSDLYYYHFTSNSYIDNRISKAFKEKRNFNERRDIDF